MTTPDPKKSSASSLDSKLEAEIEAALGDMSLDDMMDVSDTKRAAPAAPGQQVGGRGGGSQREEKTGLIVDVRDREVYVEFGPKSQGVCPLDHFSEPPQPGTKENFLVDRYDRKEGLLILTRPGSVQKAEWESLEIGQTVEARCTGVNKGGLEMEVAKHRAFMPAGQVDVRHIAELEVFVGEKMPCEVIELDRQRGRIILSRRSVLEAERGRLRENLLENLEVGQQLPAVITSIQPYGAFADLGGMDGLIHISDLSYERINDPSEVVKEGDQVEVRVLKIDTAQDPPRIGLGLKQTMSDPYEEKAGAISEGDEVTGKVTKLMAFGAFVELSPGVEGLIHISELSHERVHKVSSVVKPGELVKVKVVAVDHDNRRIGLSLKQMATKEQSENFDRGEDPEMRKLKAQLSEKFGELKGGLG